MGESTITTMPMNKMAVERRATIIRYISRAGGTVKGVKAKDLAADIGIPHDQLTLHMRRLEEFGVIEVKRPFIAGIGRLPNEYRVLRDEKWFREHADALDQQSRKRVHDANTASRKAEEARVDARRAAVEQRVKTRKTGEQRLKQGLPRTPPPPGVPDPKPVPVSDAFRKQLVEEGLNLPAAELAKWGA